MGNKELKSVIEALLFVWGDPLKLSDISKVLGQNQSRIYKILEEMMDDFDYNMRGIRIIKTNDSYQLGTRPEHFQWIKKLTHEKPEKILSNAALETLSIIAYRQPVIKSDIEAIRGVRCDRVIETLIEKDLVKEMGRMDRVGRPILYGTTEMFLRAFGLQSLDELPSLKDNLEEISKLDENNTEL